MKTQNLFFGSILFLLLINPITSFSQDSQDPTLSVGLESLTFGKGTIDVDALRKIIVKKQNELKREGLKRYIFTKFPDYNYTTKLFMQNAINTLVDEKNQNIIEKEILELATNYALIMGFTKLYKEVYYNNNINDSLVKSNNKIFSSQLIFFYDSTEMNILKNEKDQLLIDIVGTQLSNNELLKKKGFFDFDSRVNYLDSRLYKKIKNDSTIEFNQNSFDLLKTEIDDIVNSYLNSYNFIKEILETKDYNKLKNIRKHYLDEINKTNFDEKLFKNYAKSQGDDDLLTLFNIGYLINEYQELVNEYNEKQKKLSSYDINKEELNKKQFIGGILIDSVEKNMNLVTLKKLNFENYQKEFNSIEKVLDSAANKLKKIKSLAGFIIQDEHSIVIAREDVRNIRTKITSITSNADDIRSKYNNVSEAIRNIRKLDSERLLTISTIADTTKKKTENKKALDEINIKLKKLELNLDSIASEYNFSEISKSLGSLNNLDEFKIALRNRRNTIFNDKKKNIGFLKKLLKDVSSNLLKENLDLKDSIFLTKKADFFSNLYISTRKLSDKDNFTIDDVLYFENTVLPELVKAKILISHKKNDEIIDDIITATNGIIPLMNYFLIPPELEGLEINDDVISFFGFISNINQLDKANTFSFILQLLDESHKFFIKSLDDKIEQISIDNLEGDKKAKYQKLLKFKNVYEKVINGIDKYTIINNNEEIIEIDVLSFLNTFIDDYNKENSYGKNTLYFSIGFSQNLFLSDYNYMSNNQMQNINTIGFASEKIGYKRKLYGFKNSHYENLAKSSIAFEDKSKEPNPFINQLYVIAYGSGILYKIADLTTNENFDFPHIGIGTGLRFYNTLDISITIGFPFIDGQNFGDNAFVGFSMDIPITEYLSAIGSKN